MTDHAKPSVDTLAVHAGDGYDLDTGAVMPPIALASTYRRQSVDATGPYFYSRIQNPTRAALEEAVAQLEGAAGAAAFGSGVAAIAACFDLCRAGQTVVSCRQIYGGTYRLLTRLADRRGLSLRWFDLRDPATLEAAIDSSTGLVWLESPSNPTLDLGDLKRLATIARDAGAVSAIDATFTTPILQQPLALGVDLAVHSTTKYINGHSDVIGGMIACRTEALTEEIQFIQRAGGAIPSPFDAYLTLRGLKTLPLRMQRHCQNAAELASRLEAHPKASRVRYPGLPSHPQHALAQKQMRGFGAIISFVHTDGPDAAKAFCAGLEHFALADSLGGIESLVCHPASMSHGSMAAEDRAAAGISDALVRLSIGIEGVEDLWAAIERSFA